MADEMVDNELSGKELEEAKNKKMMAGILGILLGFLGIHKFVLGYTTPGLIMLLVSVLTCGVGYFVMHIIGVIEGIMYLTKTDQEFYETYMVENTTVRLLH